MRKLIVYIGLAILEAMPPALLLAFWGAPAALIPLLAAVGGAALIDTLVQRMLPAERQRIVRAAAVLLLALWATKSLVLGSMSLFSGWGRFAELGAEPGAWSFVVLVVALYAAWRGLRIPLYENEGLREIFARSMAALLGVLVIGSWTSRHEDPILPAVVTSELVIAFAAGLVTVALARQDDIDHASRPLGWRNLTPIFAAIGVILLLSIVLGSLLGGGAAEVLLNGLTLILGAIGALLLPIIIVLLSGLAWIMEQLHVERAFLALQDLSRFLQSNRLAQSNALLDATRTFPWLGPLLTWTGRLLPVIVLLAAIYLFSRRRNSARAGSDEERESLFSWSQLADDLRDLLGSRRKNGAPGLQAALANLRGNDPVSRVRRSYIRMLIAAEQRQQPRPAPQTPHEYLPRAQVAFPQASQSVSDLTGAYEKARYHPQSVTEPDAEAAERAFDALER
jgi:hypothetical protein